MAIKGGIVNAEKHLQTYARGVPGDHHDRHDVLLCGPRSVCKRVGQSGQDQVCWSADGAVLRAGDDLQEPERYGVQILRGLGYRRFAEYRSGEDERYDRVQFGYAVFVADDKPFGRVDDVFNDEQDLV